MSFDAKTITSSDALRPIYDIQTRSYEEQLDLSGIKNTYAKS